MDLSKRLIRIYSIQFCSSNFNVDKSNCPEIEFQGSTLVEFGRLFYFHGDLLSLDVRSSLLLTFAFEMDIFRPSTSRPSSFSNANPASSSSGISTNPKPRDLPVTRSVITLADFTSPKGVNRLLRFSSEK